ncbi:putative microtubule-associated protein, MAP65/Ase1/PRC1 [Dioscorea sansibarensis]
MERERGVLLQEIQAIWDEIGETEEDRERMMLEMEQECLEVYRRNVDKINRSRVEILQAIADSKTEFEAICSALGEPNVHLKKTKQNASSLKEVLKESIEQLDLMQKVKSDRLNQFLEIIEQIRGISIEIGQMEFNPSLISLNDFDLSVRKLEELQTQLHLFESEKTDRLNLVMDHLGTLKSLCLVLGLNYEKTVYEIHPRLKESEDKRSITDDTIEKLGSAVESLRNVKQERMQKLQDLATTMLELWHLMDTPIEEQQSFRRVTCNIAASEHEITEPDALSIEFINHVSLATKTPKRKGAVDPLIVLDQIESEICNAKDEVFSRKEIIEKVEKWIAACEEESWLEEYNRDENRYSAGKGAHLALRRAEKARATVNKIPGMAETLIAKTVTWEKDRGKEFTYDGAGLLSMLENYMNARQEKEQERKRQRVSKT